MEQRKKAIICLEGLGKQFQTTNGTVTALDDINLEILQGEIFGIIGLSGAGKSTLVRCINYLETPTAGRVIFEGQNLSMMKEAEIRKARQSMGMIFQQFNLLAQRNVLQNVCFPMEIAGVPKAEAKKRAAELLKLVGLEERMKAYPAQLSGGQKQRVAIAILRRADHHLGQFLPGGGIERRGGVSAHALGPCPVDIILAALHSYLLQWHCVPCGPRANAKGPLCPQLSQRNWAALASL